MNALRNTIADNLPKETAYTIEEFAEELGVTKMRVRQLLSESFRRRLLPNISFKNGTRVLYPDTMVRKMVDIYQSGKIAKPRKANRVETNNVAPTSKNAKMILEVPVFDDSVKDILIKQFGNEHKIVEYLKDSLHSAAKPVMRKLADLEREYQDRKQKLLQGAG